MAVIAIDFDRTIQDNDHPVEGRRMGPPFTNANAVIRELMAGGHYIIIHSCNNPKVIRDWMNYYEIPYDDIWDGQGKPVADIYVDDRALRFNGDWVETLGDIREAIGH